MGEDKPDEIDFGCKVPPSPVAELEKTYEEIQRLQAELSKARRDYKIVDAVNSSITANANKVHKENEQLTKRIEVLEGALQEIYDTGEGSVISGGFCTESMINDMREGMETIILQAKEALEDK